MKILIAVDERVCAESISDFLRKHVWQFPCDFKVIHVIRPLGDGDITSFLRAPLRGDILEERRQSAERLVRRVTIALRDTLHTSHVEEEVLDGDPREKIVRCAQEWGANLIVVGSHCPPSAVSRLGSVSSSVAAGAPCSVFVIRADKTCESAPSVAK